MTNEIGSPEMEIEFKLDGQTGKIIASCIVGEKPLFPVEPFLMSRFEEKQVSRSTDKFQPAESRIRSPLS